MASYPHYKTTLCEPGEIRLISVSRNEKEMIQCDFVYDHLFQEQRSGLSKNEDSLWGCGLPYYAMSYTWGSETAEMTVSLDGEQFPVTKNLFRALEDVCLREPGAFFWIDAICINQQAATEKSHQVGQMAAIYEAAQQVVIYLGRAPSTQHLLMTAFEQFDRETRGEYHEPDSLLWTDRWRFSRARSTLDIEMDTATQKSSMEILFSHSWFERVWIIQEVAKARSAIVSYAGCRLSTRIFALMPKLIPITIGVQHQAVLDVMPGSTRRTSWWTKDRSLVFLLLKFRSSKARYSMDRIYALLEICDDDHARSVLVPDYTQSEHDAVREVIGYIYDVPVNALQSFILSVDGLFEVVAGKPQMSSLATDIRRYLEEHGKVEAVLAPPSKKRNLDSYLRERTADDPSSTAAQRPRLTHTTPSVYNRAPTQALDFFIFGAGSSGELGLGARKYHGKLRPLDVKRPRVHHILNAEDVVQVACGALHSIALTSDNRILTWGDNDGRLLGRDTNENWRSNIDDYDSDFDYDDDTGMDPLQCTPMEVDYGVELDCKRDVFTQVAASAGASFVLTEKGEVFGWGCYRPGGDGPPHGFIASRNEPCQVAPTRIVGLKDIVQLTCGSNHVLALDSFGRVYSWGDATHGQLGRRTLPKRDGSVGTKKAGLSPGLIKFPFTKAHFAVKVRAGAYHSFFIDNYGAVYGWGLNNFSQVSRTSFVGGNEPEQSEIPFPIRVPGFEGMIVKDITGGNHHSVACTADGRLWTWGLADDHRLGHHDHVYTAEKTHIEPPFHRSRPSSDSDPHAESDMLQRKSLLEPTELAGVPDAVTVTCGTDHTLAVTAQGHVYTWGYSLNYQTGQGITSDVVVPTRITNTTIMGRKIVWAGAGSEFSILAAERE